MLYTSLDQIKSFNPCASGLRKIKQLTGLVNDFTVFEMTRCFETNRISDVLWLLGQQGNKAICVEFAQWCADSVAHLKNNQAATDAAYAADAAADAAAYVAAAAYAAAAAAYAAADAAAYAAAYAAADAAAYADADAAAAAAYAAADAAAYADADAAAARTKQQEKLIQLIGDAE